MKTQKIAKMNSAAKYISNYFLEIDIIAQDKYDWCVYAVHKKMSLFIVLAVYIVLSLAYFNIFEAGLMAVVLLSFRGRTGGYHAKSSFACFALSIGIMLLGMWFTTTVLKDNLALTAILYLASVLCLLLLAPVNHPNMHFNKQEYIANKEKVKNLIKLSVIIVMVCLSINKSYANIIITAIAIDAASVLFAKVIKQEVAEK